MDHYKNLFVLNQKDSDMKNSSSLTICIKCLWTPRKFWDYHRIKGSSLAEEVLRVKFKRHLTLYTEEMFSSIKEEE